LEVQLCPEEMEWGPLGEVVPVADVVQVEAVGVEAGWGVTAQEPDPVVTVSALVVAPHYPIR